MKNTWKNEFWRTWSNNAIYNTLECKLTGDSSWRLRKLNNFPLWQQQNVSISRQISICLESFFQNICPMLNVHIISLTLFLSFQWAWYSTKQMVRRSRSEIPAWFWKIGASSQFIQDELHKGEHQSSIQRHRWIPSQERRSSRGTQSVYSYSWLFQFFSTISDWHVSQNR